MTKLETLNLDVIGIYIIPTCKEPLSQTAFLHIFLKNYGNHGFTVLDTYIFYTDIKKIRHKISSFLFLNCEGINVMKSS